MEYYLGQISLSDPPITIPLQKDIVIVGTELLQPHIYPKMSEQHAKLYIKKDHVYIRDLFSKYGTYVNGVKIESDEDTLLNINDIICFGVNPNSIEIGFVCVLLGAKSEDSNNIINQQAVSIKKEPPEIIDLSDEDDIPKIPIDSVKTVNPNCLDFKTSDVQENAEQLRNRNLEILIEEGRECVRDVHNVPSTSRERTSFEKWYPPTKKCSAPLMECDSESYLRPPDVKDSFLFESEDEDNLSMRKKHPKRISSDSKSSSSKRSNNWKNDTSHHKKRARIISSDYSNESSVEPINSIYCKNQKLFPQQPKAENILSSSNVALPELSSSDFSVKKLDKNAYVNKNKFVNSFKIPKLSTSDSSVKSSNKNLHLNSLNKSNRETAKPSSYENYQKNIQKAEDGEKLLQIPKNINTDTRMMKSGTRKLAEIRSRTIKLEEDSRHRALNETDSYSATEKIIDESNGDDYCNIDRTHNFIPTKTEPEDAEVPEYNNFKEIFEGVEELDGPPSNVIPKNSAFENEGLETIEKIEQFVNCSAQKNLAELECGENNIEKSEAEETLFQIPKNIITDTTKMKSETRKLAEIGSRTMKQEEDSCNEAFYENDSHSVAKEIINVSDGDNYFDNDRAQNFIPIKTEPEDTEVSADNIFKDSRRRYFKDDDESKGLPSNAISKTTAFENERLETIKKTEQFVNCSAQRNSAQSECGENKELNSKVTDSESEMSSEDSFLPSMKSLLFPNSKSGVNNSSKSCGKILLTDPKPMTYRPRRIRGRDEGYVERQKSLDLCPKRKRGRPRKEEQIQSEAINLNSPVAITKIPNKPVERSISLNNFKLKTAPEGKNTPKAGPSGTNNVKSAIKLLSNPKSFHSCLSFDKGENGNYSEKQKSIDFFMKRKKNRPQKCSELEQEVNNSYTEKQLCEKPQKCKQKNSVNDYRTNVSLSRSTGTKESRKNTKSSVKIRPDKFSSRMGFLIHGVDAKPLRREKISENSKMYKCVSNAETNASQVQFLDIVGANGLKQNAAVENIVVSENVYPISGIEDEHSEEKRSSFSNNLQNKNAKDSTFQEIPYSTSHVKILKDSSFQDIPHSSTDASSTHILTVENLENSMIQNIPHISADASNRISMHRENQKLFPQQSKTENILSSSNVALLELSSSDFSVKKLDKNAYVNKNNFLNSFKIPKLSTSDSSVKSSNKNLHLNSLNKSNRETAEPSSYENYQKNIQKAEAREKLLQIPKNINTDTRIMKSGTRKLSEIWSRTIKLEEDSRHEAFNETDSYSAAEKIIDVSNGDDYFDIDRAHNFIPTKIEPEDAEVPEYNNFKEIFEGVDESEGSPSNAIPKNFAFENEGLETIEKTEQFVNCFAQRNSAELECGENNIEKSEAEEKLFQIPKNIITDTTMMKSETGKLAEICSRRMKLEEDRCHEAFNENDSHSVAKEIINVSHDDNYFDNGRAQNFIPINAEAGDTEVPTDNIFKASRRRYFKDDHESKTLQSKNSEDSTFQEIRHSLTNASSTPTSHVKNLKHSSFQDIPHSSTDASSTHILTVENLENSMIHNIPHISTDASNRISMHREDTQLPIELSFNGMVKSLLKLNPIWLQEQFKMSHPPPDVIQGVKILPDFFTSYESYAASFFPLLKLKIWQSMFEASKSVLPNIQNGKRFSFRILSDVIKSDYIELKCESVVNSKCDLEPCEGVMTILEMNTNSHQSYPLFGFIIKHKVNPLNLNLLHHCWRKIPAEYLKDAKRLIFHVWIKRKELLFEKDILMSGNRICYLRNSLRLVDALLCFKDSPLMTDIIKPRLPTFALTFSESSSNSEYTPRQLEIIHAVCSEIYKPYLECKITLIRGPSGTGKTHIIIGILKTLFHASEYNSNLKILVTAPSNGAVDEIGCRLIELNERCGWRDAIKFVRVGVEKKVPSKMLPFFLDRKAEALYEKHKERELQALRLKISNLEKEPNSLIKKKELQNLNEQCKFIEDNFSLKKAHYKTEIKYKCDILKESHIVLTTLSGCNLSILCKTFLPTSKSDLNFSCCIVDQSTRCTELEILQPLAFGISKLILVGDDRQLPAAHSECSNHNRSMLERFCQYFRSSNQPSPVVSLTEQFHVHPSTCQFPSTSKDI